MLTTVAPAYNLAYHARQEGVITPAGVLGVEFHIVAMAPCQLHRMHGALNRLILGHVQLLTQMLGADAEARVYARTCGIPQRLSGHLYVAVKCTG